MSGGVALTGRGYPLGLSPATRRRQAPASLESAWTFLIVRLLRNRSGVAGGGLDRLSGDGDQRGSCRACRGSVENGVVRIAFVAYHGSVHTRRWAAYYAAAGHDVHVVTCGGEPRGEGYEVHDLGAPPFGKVGYLVRLPAARRAIAGLRPDVVHAHWATSYGLLALASGVRPLVVTAHGDDVLIAPGNPALRLVVRRVLRAAQLVTVPSEQMRDAVRELAGPGTSIDVFQYGVEADRLEAVAAAARAGRRHATDTLELVSARPLLRLYRFEVLLDALALLASRGIAWHCTLFGDGPERSALEAQTQRLAIADRVDFRGHRQPEEVEQALARADLFVSVAESDGASIALLEALALGAVPVLSDIPANRAWVEDGVNGVLTALVPAAVADAIERAAALDSVEVRSVNTRLVAAHGDRDTNLAALESRLREIAAPPAARVSAEPVA